MTRYVIGPDVAIRLAHDEAAIRREHQIPAPALLRSQVLSLLYQAAHRGEITRRDAETESANSVPAGLSGRSTWCRFRQRSPGEDAAE
jgi:hypothetical protein